MALELIGGTVFTVLYDGFKKALGESATFRYLLRDLKITLDCLRRLKATAIEQLGEYNVVLNLPNEEIEDLKKQMEEGAKLVGKLSNFGTWNYCCINSYTDQLVDLDRCLRRLFENLQVHQARDVKEILDLSRKNRKDLEELKEMLLNIQQFQQKAGDVVETLASNTETMPERNEANGEDQVASSLERRAVLGAAFGVLFDVVIRVKDKNMMFRPLLGDLKSTLDALKPLIEEIAQHNNVLDRPKEEIETFLIQIDDGVELVRKCSKVRQWASFKKYKYTTQLLGFDDSLRRELKILREQLEWDVRETFTSIRNLEIVVKRMQGSGVLQNHLEIESPSHIVGISDVIKETLVSARKKEEGVKEKEGSGVVQNDENEIKGSCEVSEPPPSTVGLETLNMQEYQGTRDVNLQQQTRHVEEIIEVSITEDYNSQGSTSLSNSPTHLDNLGHRTSGESTHQYNRGQGVSSRSNETHKKLVPKSVESKHSIARSPLHDNARISGTDSPSWEAKASYGSSYGAPGRSRLRPRGNEIANIFGQWDENKDPASNDGYTKTASDDGYTNIFNKARKERAGNVPGMPPDSSDLNERMSTANANAKGCCFGCCG